MMRTVKILDDAQMNQQLATLGLPPSELISKFMAKDSLKSYFNAWIAVAQDSRHAERRHTSKQALCLYTR